MSSKILEKTIKKVSIISDDSTVCVSSSDSLNEASKYHLLILDRLGKPVNEVLCQEEVSMAVFNLYRENGFGRPYLRERLPNTRDSITHKFDIAGHEGYLIVGLYRDGRPGELFITMAKEGSTIGGIMDAYGTAISLCLQSGVPLKGLVEKFSHSRFEPSGFTKNSDIPIAKSIVDYIFRWLNQRFISTGKDLGCSSERKVEPSELEEVIDND